MGEPREQLAGVLLYIMPRSGAAVGGLIRLKARLPTLTVYGPTR